MKEEKETEKEDKCVVRERMEGEELRVIWKNRRDLKIRTVVGALWQTLSA